MATVNKGGAWRKFEIRATLRQLRPWHRLDLKITALFVGTTVLAVGMVAASLYTYQKEEIENAVGTLLESIAGSAALQLGPQPDARQQDTVKSSDRVRAALDSVRAASRLDVRPYLLTDIDTARRQAVLTATDIAKGGPPHQQLAPEFIGPLNAVLANGTTAHTEWHLRDDRQWVTAFAPQRDRAGRVIGVLAVDFDLHAYMQRRELLINTVLGAAIAGALIALIAGVLLARRITRPISALTAAACRVTEGDLSQTLPVRSADEVGQLTRAFNAMLGGLRQRDFIRDAFGRYVSPEVARALLESPDGLRLGGAKREITILMADLRGYTNFAVGTDADAVMRILNEYLARMADTVLRHGGIVNEFLGDAVFAIFGAPVAAPDHAKRAAAAALAMQQAVADINAQHAARGLPQLSMGIGINSGEAMVGNIGSEERAKYAAVGSAVNLAARIEGAAAAGQILVSSGTYEHIGAIAQVGAPVALELKGICEPCVVYELRGLV